MAETVVALDLDSLNRDEVLRYLGYRAQQQDDEHAAGRGLSAEYARLLDQTERRCLSIARPRAALRTFAVVGTQTNEEGLPELVLADCALRLPGHSIAAHLAGAQAVGIVAVTLGTAFERELRRLALTDPTAELVMDAVGTAAIERAADAAEALLVAEARERGLFPTWRYSPGYGDFPLSTQPTLLATLDAQRRLGITLTNSLLMIPTKSVTAVVGMLESPRPQDRPGCPTCNLRDHCTVRRTGRTCHG